MAQTSYKVLIPTSGIGAPLGDITKYTNKSLIKIGKKPTISYILESYPKNTEFVITLGHFKEHVQEFLELAYPHLNITFVEIDHFQGKGSSLAYSMLQAEKYLNTPFVYHASDTIIMDTVPYPDENWIMGFKAEGSSHYASFDVFDGIVRHIYDKGTLNPDYLYIGLAGIKDSAQFWKYLQNLYEKYTNNENLNDVHAFQMMMNTGTIFKIKRVNKWYDVGNVDSLNRVRIEIPDSFHILDKIDESIFIFDYSVVKFFHNEDMVAKRVERAHYLRGLIPEIEGNGKNFYKYKYIDGRLFSKVANPSNFKELLGWAQKNLWRPMRNVSDEEFKDVCRKFYYNKSLERIDKFLKSRSIEDRQTIINDEVIPPVRDLIKETNFDWLCQTEQRMFHGDFILDNIIKTNSGYCLLDWRQDFGGLLKSGDMYYDLSKLNHNLVVNHDIINDNLFTIDIHEDVVICDIYRRENLVQCQKLLFEFLTEQKLDSKRVRLLTALVWLNMSPLHHHPFDLFLFYFGKLNLWKALNQ